MNDITLKEALALIESCPLAILLLDEAGQMRGFNAAFRELVGESVTLHAGQHQDVYRDGLLAPLLGQGTLVNWIMPEGEERWLAVTSVPLQGEAGGSVRYYADVTEQLRLKNERNTLSEELRSQALKDGAFPSLLSRRGILVTLEPLVARSRRYNSPMSLIAVGIASEQDRQPLLTRFVSLLQDQTRWADLIGCNEEHDFILILQETTRDSALRLVEKLSARIADMSEAEPAIRVSYGVTECQKNDDAETLLERAEAALAEARNNQSGTAIAI